MRLGIAAGLFGGGLVAGAVGCFGSSSDNGTPSTGTDSGGTVGDDSSTSVGTDGGTVGTDGGGGPTTTTESELDYMGMTGAPTATGGYWYTFSDRTCVSFQPPLILADASSPNMSPQEGQQFDPIDVSANPSDPKAPTIGGAAFNYREVTGGGNANWGAGFGFDLLDSPEGINAYAICTATPETCSGNEAPDAFTPPVVDGGAGAVSRATAFDVTGDGPHKGIAFWGRAVGAATPIKVDVQFSDKSTNPSGTTLNGDAGGITCNACKYGAGGAGGCADDFIETVNLSDTWTERTILFSDTALKTVGWSNGNKSRPATQLDLKTLFYIHFQLSTSEDGKPLKPFDITIAHVSWVD